MTRTPGSTQLKLEVGAVHLVQLEGKRSRLEVQFCDEAVPLRLP